MFNIIWKSRLCNRERQSSFTIRIRGQNLILLIEQSTSKHAPFFLQPSMSFIDLDLFELLENKRDKDRLYDMYRLISQSDLIKWITSFLL